MTSIVLTITNMDVLPDGGSLTFRSDGQPFEIGRDSHRDWTLPDQRFFISGRHCAIQSDGRSFALTDYSRNGTYLNGSRNRIKSPYILQDGDTLVIGDYVISVKLIVGQAGNASLNTNPWNAAVSYDSGDDDIWGTSTSGPKPMDRREFRPISRPSPAQADFVNSNLSIHAEQTFGQPVTGPAPFTSSNPFAAPAVPKPFQVLDSETEQPASTIPLKVASSGGGDMLSAFKTGARLQPHALANRNQSEVAQEVGAMMLLVCEQMALLLKARASAKALVKTRDRTVIGALDNNPLKFMADPTEALDAMLSKDRSGYLDGMRALKEAFNDISTHELATFAAMQKALSRLLSDLSPEVIEAKVQKGAFSNAKAKAWETFVQRWDAKTEAHENGMLDVFLMYFSEAYQEAVGKKRI